MILLLRLEEELSNTKSQKSLTVVAKLKKEE